MLSRNIPRYVTDNFRSEVYKELSGPGQAARDEHVLVNWDTDPYTLNYTNTSKLAVRNDGND